MRRLGSPTSSAIIIQTSGKAALGPQIRRSRGSPWGRRGSEPQSLIQQLLVLVWDLIFTNRLPDRDLRDELGAFDASDGGVQTQFIKPKRED
jgi:hypothetical protein